MVALGSAMGIIESSARSAILCHMMKRFIKANIWAFDCLAVLKSAGV
jgi:hypothetical protein